MKTKENLKKRKDKLQKLIGGLGDSLKKADAQKGKLWESLKQKISPGMQEARDYSKTRRIFLR